VIAVSFLRTKVSAIAVVASMFVALSDPVFAQTVHPVCVAKQHECGQTAKIVKCCCGDQDASRNDSTPVQSRLEVRGDMTAASVVPNVMHVVSQLASFAPVDTSPPRLCLLDLPTLFVAFLI
jgi:hypothetical protein